MNLAMKQTHRRLCYDCAMKLDEYNLDRWKAQKAVGLLLPNGEWRLPCDECGAVGFSKKFKFRATIHAETP